MIRVGRWSVSALARPMFVVVRDVLVQRGKQVPFTADQHAV